MLVTSYQQFIHLSRYSRFDDVLGRRETWPETVARYFDFFEEVLAKQDPEGHVKLSRPALEKAVLNLDVCRRCVP